MPDPHNNQVKPAAENSDQSSSFVDKINAFVSDPKPSGSDHSTWVPVRDQAMQRVSQEVFRGVSRGIDKLFSRGK